MSRAHYAGTYQVDAKRCTDAAYANPATRCWRCGRTLAEHRRKWTAGHVEDGRVGGLLLAECEPCNKGRGASLGNRRRQGLTPTRDWYAGGQGGRDL